MSWRQLVTPNINVSAELGMCLAYVQNAYGSGWAGSFALDGWNRNKLNHADRNIPAGVFVPIWFEGYWNGVNYGHVAIYKDGVVYSSPYTNKNSHDQLGNIATVERIYGMSYIGWSEDIGGTKVISPVEEDEVIPTRDLLKSLIYNYTGEFPNEQEYERYVGKISYSALIPLLDSGKPHQRKEVVLQTGRDAVDNKWEARIKQLESELAARPTGEFELIDEPVFVKKQATK